MVLFPPTFPIFSHWSGSEWHRMPNSAKKKKKERKNNTMLQGNFYERLHFSMDSCTIRPMASLFSIAFMFIPIFLRLEGMPHANKKLEMWQKKFYGRFGMTKVWCTPLQMKSWKSAKNIFMADLAWPKLNFWS